MKTKKTKRYDIVVGIPSLNSEETIAHVTKAVTLGLIKYFPMLSSLIVNADSGSKDKTTRVFNNCCVGNSDLNSIILHDYHPINKKLVIPKKMVLKCKLGKGNALKKVFETASKYNAKACVVVDSDLRSITPEWIQLLAAPIAWQNFDYVTPLYSRHKYDGTITNSIIYPLTTALYGKNIRQPIGGEFGLSKALYENLLKKDTWETNVLKFGVDIWMTTTAITEKYKIAQVFLGAKLHAPKDPAKSLGPMFLQVITTLFELMEEHQNVWKKIKREKTTALFGFEAEVEPAPIEINEKELTQKFREGIRKFRGFYKEIFTPEVFKKIAKYELPVLRNITKYKLPILKNLARNGLLEFSPSLWSECIYQIALSFHKNKGNPKIQKQLIEALLPLYLGFVAGFSEVTKNISSHESEIFIEKIAEAFENKKPYLIKHWK